MNPEDEKLLKFLERAELHAQLPVVEELQAMGKTLIEMRDKDIEFPEPLPFPEIPKVDLTETNKLLGELLAASVALPVTGTLSNASHYYVVKALIETATAGNVRLRLTMGASGSALPLRDSYFKVRRLPAGNAGTFVA